MEEALDAIIAQLNIIKDLESPTGFLDQLDLPDNIWFGNPGILAAQQYPYIYVEPQISVPRDENTGSRRRTLTIRIALLVDPRTYWDEAEIVEQTASREMIRTMESIEQWFERDLFKTPNGLAPGVQKVVVAQTEYAQQVRGSLYSQGASIVLTLDKSRPRTQ